MKNYKTWEKNLQKISQIASIEDVYKHKILDMLEYKFTEYYIQYLKNVEVNENNLNMLDKLYYCVKNNINYEDVDNNEFNN